MAADETMQLLIAEDNKAIRRTLEMMLGKWGYDVVATAGGNEAWERLQAEDGPKLALLDWQMPGMDGVDICRKVQETKFACPPYIILLTSKDKKEDIIEGLGSGASDFVPKSSDKDVLRARLDVGKRAVQLQESLARGSNGNSSDFQEKEAMEKTIADLKKKAIDLEQRLEDQNQGASQAEEPSGAGANVLDEIVIVFKRGEINLPSPPQIGIKFKEMMSKGANLIDIGNLLKQDAAVSSKLISISNSAFYRGVAENKNLEQAVGRLGLTTTKQYVDAISNRSLYYTKNKNMKAVIERLWEHSLASAYAAQITCKVLNIKMVQDPFTLGLLHDIGRLVLLQAVGELQLKKKIGEAIDSSDLANTIDQNHGKFGAALLKRWKFSDEYIHVSSYHDNIEDTEHTTNDLLVVHFANLLVKTIGYATTEGEEVDLENAPSTNLLKLDGDHIEKIKEMVTNHMDEMKNYFK